MRVWQNIVDNVDTLSHNAAMPPKVKELERMLLRAGFIRKPGKGSHRKYYMPGVPPVVISGQGGEDAAKYKIDAVEAALKLAKNLK